MDLQVSSYLPSEIYNFNWTIKNFDQRCSIADISKGNHPPITRNHMIDELCFTAGAKIGVLSNWRLAMYKMTNGFVSIFLEFNAAASAGKRVPAEFQLILQKRKPSSVGSSIITLLENATGTVEYNPDESERFPSECYHYTDKMPSVGFSKFQTVQQLKEKKYLVDGQLTILVRIMVFGVSKRQIDGRQQLCLLPTTTDGCDEDFNQFKRNKNLTQDFAKLWENGKFSDVVLSLASVQPKLEIKAHKTILIARSTVFASTILDNPDIKEIVIPYFSPEVIKLMLKFLYTGMIDSGWRSIVLEFLRAAVTYELKDLIEFLNNNMAFVITKDNAVAFLQAAKMYSLSVAEKAIMEFIRGNLDASMESALVKY